MKTIRIIGRNSALSLLQMQLVQQKVQAAFLNTTVELLPRSSRGDALQNIPLQTVEGSDFFTQDIYNALSTGEADIAVHSLKDMSSEHFFGTNHFAVVDRDDVRDIAIFHENIIDKLKRGEKISIGTCSPRRELMALDFLQKALPQLGAFTIKANIIRGNVDTRLQKLHRGEYDGIILATAGLNRLLRNATTAANIKALLHNKPIMLLPLIECVPAPCQGAIVAEAHSNNKEAIAVLQTINNIDLYNACVAEKKTAIQYGVGCLQQFGVTTIAGKHGAYIYAAGKDSTGATFTNWQNLPAPPPAGTIVFSATDYMKDFFSYNWEKDLPDIKEPVLFIANYKALKKNTIEKLQLSGVSNTLNALSAPAHQSSGSQKMIVASGTRTWLELAKQGLWVSAAADGLGFESLLAALQMPLLQIDKSKICIITHRDAAVRWQSKGYAAASNYSLQPKTAQQIVNAIKQSHFVFWTSFTQYQHYKHYCQPGITHGCAGGETAAQLQQQGITPIIFPTIKAFEQWRWPGVIWRF
jgi:hydroxymethylbilane synthase